MQRPSIGRIVLVGIDPMHVLKNGGQSVAAAIITRVWSDTKINARILFDGDETQHRTALVRDDHPLAIDTGAPAPLKWVWPPRV